jgi:hypothetical protein
MVEPFFENEGSETMTLVAVHSEEQWRIDVHNWNKWTPYIKQNQPSLANIHNSYI